MTADNARELAETIAAGLPDDTALHTDLGDALLTGLQPARPALAAVHTSSPHDRHRRCTRDCGQCLDCSGCHCPTTP